MSVELPKDLVEEAIRRSGSEVRLMPGITVAELNGKSCLAVVADPTDYTKFIVELVNEIEECNAIAESLSDTTLYLDLGEVTSDVRLNLTTGEPVFYFPNARVVE